jgi:hypothetical protein
LQEIKIQLDEMRAALLKPKDFFFILIAEKEKECGEWEF